ncbi:MAG: T9SS type A sorting domain-containing protein [Candidatus Marinimicrobia bacterium]|nr:T9SS type A sorting domain-containing protein [Candidatus Neomarinimicrobiota bacterium]
MRFRSKNFLILSIVITILFMGKLSLYQEPLNAEDNEGCTIGVAAGIATPDGRPMIWKNRDTEATASNASVFWSTGDPNEFEYLAVISGGNTNLIYQGVNSQGFAIVNSLIDDLPQGTTGPGNGTFIRMALESCGTVAEFIQLLNQTNISGRRTQANFAVLDSTGDAKMIEAGGNVYWVYDAAEAPNGYIVRANFSMAGDGVGGPFGHGRFVRSSALISDFHAGDSLNHRSIIRYQMREFNGIDGSPIGVPSDDVSLYPVVPIGYISNAVSICRSICISATVVHGVIPDEPARTTTMWNLLGQPSTAIALPYWPIGEAPAAATGLQGCTLSDIANSLLSGIDTTIYINQYQMDLEFINTPMLRNYNGEGLWANIFPAEDSIFSWTESQLANWRNTGNSGLPEILAFESEMAELAVSTLEYGLGVLSVDGEPAHAPRHELLQNYPNPFNPITTISYTLAEQLTVKLKIFDIQGREIMQLQDASQPPGSYQMQWSGQDHHGNQVSTGVYFCRLEANDFSTTIKMLFLK